MKRFIVLLSLVATVVVSCSIEEESPAVTEGGHHITLSGESYTATKVSIGAKDGDVYPLLWYTGDAIGIYSTDGTWTREIAELYSTSVGSASGIFQTSNDLEAETDMDLVVVYPGSSVSYSDGVVSGSVSSNQTQRSANSSIHIGNNCVSYAETSINAGQTEGVKFALNQKTAFVKVIVKMDEYPDFELTSVSMLADGFNLAGSMLYDLATGETTVRNGSSSVRVSISNTSLLSSEQDVYFTCLPCDLRGTEVYLTATMTDETSTVSVPIPMNGGLLKEGCLSVIEVSGNTMLNWYEPVETRALLDGWAYGEQNTFLIEQYADAPNSINIDVRARGEFSMVKEPKYYGLLSGSSGTSGRNLCYLPDGTATYQEVPTNTVNDDCTIDVWVYSSSQATGKWATVGLYDEDYNIIWSFTIWPYRSGDEPQDVTYANNIVLMDRNIGAPYSNKLAEENKTFDGAPAYFQWGKKDAFPVDQLNASYSWEASSEYDDVGTTIARPGVLWSSADWRHSNADLWGGVNNTGDWYDLNGVGYKTIYDPCPEGYRVPDSRVLYELEDKMEYWERLISPAPSYGQDESKINTDSPFYSNNISVLAYPLPSGGYDYWPYVGYKYGTTSFTNNGSATSGQHIGYYFNSTSPSDPNSIVCIRYYYGSSAMNDFFSSNLSNAMMANPVRCQKEE